MANLPAELISLYNVHMRSRSYLGWPESFPTGATSSISSGLTSGCRVNLSGTLHKKTLPSSEPEAIRESLKGFLHRCQSAV